MGQGKGLQKKLKGEGNRDFNIQKIGERIQQWPFQFVYALQKHKEAAWDNEPHSFTEQKSFTDGRIVVTGNRVAINRRGDYPVRRAGYFMIKGHLCRMK
ncbi:MAG: hypothetical protein ABSH06_25560 [Thermodesulfobacteriota bacterium]